MAGYDYAMGMSNNAVDAYDMGIKPLTQIRASDLKGLNITLKFARWLAKNNHWSPCEYHHSGGTWFNKVNFYNVEELEDIDDIKELQEKFKAENIKTDKGVRVKGEYVLWGGSRKHPTVAGNEAFTGELKGNWIHLDGGGRKKANGNYIKFERV